MTSGYLSDTAAVYFFLGSFILTQDFSHHLYTKNSHIYIPVMKLKATCPLEKKKKNYDKPRQCNKNRDITLPTKVCTVKAMAFPGVMYGCESWTNKEG